MTLGNVVLLESFNEEKYNILDKDLLWEISNRDFDSLDKGSFERREGPKLFAIQRDIFYKYDKPVPKIMTCYRPGDANVFERGEELKLDLSMNIENIAISSSKFLFLTVEYYSFDEKVLKGLKKKREEKKSNPD